MLKFLKWLISQLFKDSLRFVPIKHLEKTENVCYIPLSEEF